MISGQNIYSILFFISAPFISLLIWGIKRKLTARMQGRIGPPLLQPFYDIMKLLGKEKSDARGEEDLFFRLSPYLIFLSSWALFLFIPASLISFELDFLFLIYLTILSGALYVLSGVSSDSPFSAIGSMREMTLMLAYETTFVVSFFNFMLYYGASSISSFSPPFPVFSLPFSTLCIIAVSFAESKLTPFDSPEADSEIMSGIKNEFSGRKLAFLEMAHYLKFLFFIFLSVLFFSGFQSISLSAIFFFIFLLFYSLMHATTARLRVDQAFRLLFAFMVVALIDFVRISYVIK